MSNIKRSAVFKLVCVLTSAKALHTNSVNSDNFI